MSGLLEWMLVIGLVFIAFGLLGGSSLAVQQRAHFWLRVVLLCVGMVAADLVLFGAMEVQLLPVHVLMLFWLLLLLSALAAAPLCCYRGASSPPGTSGDGGGGGPGGGPDPSPPDAPKGGIPLLDAAQADTRMRDHTRSKLHRAGPRRAAREPAHLPVRPRSPSRS